MDYDYNPLGAIRNRDGFCVAGRILGEKIERMDRVVPAFVQEVGESTRKLRINEEPHAAPTDTARPPAA